VVDPPPKPVKYNTGRTMAWGLIALIEGMRESAHLMPFFLFEKVLFFKLFF
jgi:hypothetical protein